LEKLGVALLDRFRPGFILREEVVKFSHGKR
jgi:hypothetical protein